MKGEWEEMIRKVGREQKTSAITRNSGGGIWKENVSSVEPCQEVKEDEECKSDSACIIKVPVLV